MPNKYSHSVVLAHYSSLGLIDLPNDQYIAYLKTYPGSTRTSISSRSRANQKGTYGSTTPSTSYGGRYRILEDDIPSSTSITGRRQYSGPVSSRRNVIIESDEASGDEYVTIHKKHAPTELAPQSRGRNEGHELRTEKRKLPSGSTYTGRSSSELSGGALPAETQQAAASANTSEPHTSRPSVINLNEYELKPAAQAPKSASLQRPAPALPPSADSKTKQITGQAMSANKTTPAPATDETAVYHPNPQIEPDFDDPLDKHFSEVTITGINSSDKDPSSSVQRSQLSKFSTSNQHTALSSNGPVPPPKRVDSIAVANHNLTKQKQLRLNRSYDTISSIASEDLVHLTTALPPVVPPKPHKPASNKTGKNGHTSGNVKVDDDAIDPRFFETLRDGPRQNSASPSRQRFAGLSSNPPLLAPRTSQQYARSSSDHTSANPDFWRGLEDMLSDSDASVVFPPDIAKYKSRDHDMAPVLKPDNISRYRTNDGELKRPTTAPDPKTSSRNVFTSNEPLPGGGQSGSTMMTNNNKEGLDNRDARKLTTVELVDTSAPKKGKRNFLRKLRKKSHYEKTP
jgi:hypothetical protein